MSLSVSFLPRDVFCIDTVRGMIFISILPQERNSLYRDT